MQEPLQSDELEVTEEETLVVVEFAGNSGEETLKQENLTFKIIGMESAEPILQIGNQLFSGEYSNTTGTDLIFKAKENDACVDRTFEEQNPFVLEYVTKSNKKLIVKRIFATPKDDASVQKEQDVSMGENVKLVSK